MVLVRDALRQGTDIDFSLMPWVFPRHLRAAVVAFGRFVRLADDIAGNAFLSREERLARLKGLEAALSDEDSTGIPEADRTIVAGLRRELDATGLSPLYARQIVTAFSQDAADVSYHTWNDVQEYCRMAAAPIGRYLLDLMNEDQATCGPPADALCSALRILKQLRDSQDIAIHHNRLCIPTQYLEDAMVTLEHLDVPKAKGQTRAVIDRVLDGVDRLLVSAAPLRDRVRTRAIASHTRIVLCRAEKLAAAFRKEDPLQKSVSLEWRQRQACTLGGLAMVYLRFFRFSQT